MTLDTHRLTLPVVTSTAHPEREAALRHQLDHKTKPLGALGQLEALALQLGLIQQTAPLRLTEPQVVVFAADHGLAAEGVSAYPQAVTVQMVLNMMQGGAAVNVLARQHGFGMTVVDAGVAADIPELQATSAHAVPLRRRPVAAGTRNMAHEAAMSVAQAVTALETGMAVVRQLPGNVLALGEMGIGNTSSASLLLHRLGQVPLADAVGRGTGLNDAQLTHKLQVLTRVAELHRDARTPLAALAAVGGFEVAMMAGAMIQAASERRVILVDGFIAGAAALVARGLSPHCVDYMVWTHRSAESGHQRLLAHMQAHPLLDLGMRLGEGSGALVAWPLVQSAAALMNEMASFESAGVSQAEVATTPAHTPDQQHAPA
jgi:nicotinate-nucleotide--dimethylbenzimidazole phosphoribosyltransferase